MSNKLHIVFKKGYMEVLLRELSEYQKYQVTGTDYYFDTFYHFAMGKETLECDTIVIIDELEGNIPIEDKAKEFIEKMKEIRFQHPKTRIIVSIPASFEHISAIRQQLYAIVIYDLYFMREFKTETLVQWIENPKNLADVKQYLSNDTVSYSKNEPIEEETEQEEKSRVARKHQKEKVRTIVEEKIVIEEKIVEKVIAIKTKNIAIHSLSRFAGASFHTLNLAAYLNNLDVNVGVYENPIYQQGRTYHADVISTIFQDQNMISVANQIAKGLPVDLKLIPQKENINFYSLNPELSQILSFADDDYIRYISHGNETIKLIDLGYIDDNFKMGWKNNALTNIDLHILCVDMMPMSIIPNLKKLKEFLKLHSNTMVIINKHTKHITAEDIEELGIEEPLICPIFDYELVFESIYNDVIPYDYHNIFSQSLNPIYDEVIEKIDFKVPISEKKKKGWNIFKKNRRSI